MGRRRLTIPELLAPAGDLEIVKTAFEYGAEAVYVGGQVGSLRADRAGFSIGDLLTARRIAKTFSDGLPGGATGCGCGHRFNDAVIRTKKIYLTLNAMPLPGEVKQYEEYLKEVEAAEFCPDAFIISDFAVAELCARIFPAVPLHLSTQTGVVNAPTVGLWKRLGISRVVLPRELSAEQIQLLSEQAPSMDFELFIHGAMCMAISGRCFFSDYQTTRRGNGGECAQPCRWAYQLREAQSGFEFSVEEFAEQEPTAYFFNSKDLCLLPRLPEILPLGLRSLKIEGRMKSAYYVAAVTRAYRLALDDLAAGGDGNLGALYAELQKTSHRGFTAGFWDGTSPDKSLQNAASADYQRSMQPVCRVLQTLGNHEYLIEQRNKFSAETELEFFGPGPELVTLQPGEYSLAEEDGTPAIDCPHPKQKLVLSVAGGGGKLCTPMFGRTPL